MANWSDVRSKIISLYQAGKLIPNINIFRWQEGSQSTGALASVIWKTHKLDFSATHAWLYGPNGLIDETDADMSGFLSTVQSAMPWPSDEPEAETNTIDDAYDELLEVEAE